MSLEPEPLVMHAPIEPVFADLNAWVDRYLARYPDEGWLRQEVVEMPGDAVAWLLREHAVGAWDLEPEELAHLWFIGRAMGWRREELLPEAVLAEALPGRADRPADPPGRWVQSLLLTGGAHRGGRGAPGKSEFPVHWDPDRTMNLCEDLVRRPAGAVALPSGDLRAFGERERVQMGAVVSAEGELLTAYPVRGEGVVHNPLDDAQRPAVALLEALLDSLQLAPDQEPRISFDELIGAGEWPHAIASLLAMDVAWTRQQRIDLAELAEVSGLEIPPWFLHGSG